jgi:uncharacterized protein
MMQKSLIINNLEFAKSQLKLDDVLVTAELTRLSEMLANEGKSQIKFQLAGASKRFSHPSLHLAIKANLVMICQRCLDEMTVNLDLNFDYLISNVKLNEADGNDVNDEIDWLEANHEMNVGELIEDELLLAMPIAPTHAHDCSKLSSQSGEKPNPFAALKGLIK